MAEQINRTYPLLDLDRIEHIRQEFPILARRAGDQALVYLDNAATSQKPQQVLQVMDDYYRRYNANVHRGVHRLSEEATAAYEQARLKVARFIHAPSDKEIIFTRGTTESINLVAQSWGRANLGPGDEVLITEMEHHSNIVPWQILRDQVGFTLRYIPLTDGGELDLSQLDTLITSSTKLVSFVHVSNVLGAINPVRELVTAARAVGAKVLLDGAQSVPHMPVDVQALDVDFLAFSSHKMCGPTGLGVLYGKREVLESMPPWQGGGDMIREVKMERSRWNTLPYKFEAGTPAVAEAIGLGAAIDYLSNLGMEWIHAQEQALVTYAYHRLSQIEGLQIIGPEDRAGLVAFSFNNIHPHDLSAILDHEGIAVRAGHHCAMPVHDRLGLVATARASFYFYNTPAEVDQLCAGLEKAAEIFAI